MLLTELDTADKILL